MPVLTHTNRPARTWLTNYLTGASSLLDWWSHYRLSDADFTFIRDDLQALSADWVVIGGDLSAVAESHIAINTEGNLLFPPEQLLATGHAKERK